MQHYAVQEACFIESLCARLNVTGDTSAKSGSGNPCWQHCLIIPAFAETFSDLARVAKESLQQIPDVLQIWIINCPDQTIAANVCRTRQCFQEAMENTRELCCIENLHLRCFEKNQVLLVDRCTAGREIPVKRGVGLARKIGGDIALALYRSGRLRSAWCGFTDADASLPRDYFQRLARLQQSAAAVFPHEHKAQGGERHSQVITHYQFKLDHHVAGLKQAGSPYAFPAIGSTIAANLKYYEKVRGIPARAAGEDFYFLNKLAKVGDIECLSGDPIVLSGRRSLRVPFGTGPAIDRSLQNGSKPLTYYNPVTYRLLEVWLASVEDFWQRAIFSPQAAHLSGSEALAKRIEDSLEKLRNQLNAILEQRSESCAACRREDLALQCISHFQLLKNTGVMISQSTNERAFRRHFHCWFDGFRTLKFIHWWRDHGLPDCPIHEQ